MIQTEIQVFSKNPKVPTIYLKKIDELKEMKLQIPHEGTEESTFEKWPVDATDIGELIEALKTFSSL